MLTPHPLTRSQERSAEATIHASPAASPHEPHTYIVANRLPVEYHAVAGWRRSPGGLVSALEPSLQDVRAVWVGWRGGPTPEDNGCPKPPHLPLTANVNFIEIPMTQLEVSHFYDGACNGAFWPLYHDAIVAPVFNPEDFDVYRRINQRFTDCVVAGAPAGARVWVHDYQLQLVPAMLREARPDLRIGFFLHVPFPSPADFEALPWKEDVLKGLLGAALIGFQTKAAADRFLTEACLHMPVRREGNTLVLNDTGTMRRVEIDVFPVGPDWTLFASLAATPSVRESAARIRSDFNSPEVMLIGVDRLDYTKGIDIRIRAVADLLKSREFKDRDIQFIQVATPSRSGLGTYQLLRAKIEAMLQAVNSELITLGLRPIHYVYQTLPPEEVAALYVATDVMLVTSLADGMNLVSKEFIACRQGGDGRLVLTRTTGAAAQLPEAWLVEPGNVDDLVRGMSDAIRCKPEEASRRMLRMRQAVFQTDARHWATSFLHRLQDLP